ncbi:unnamed protein product [Camellia sinensis]|uniref:60S ribosomal protein L34 n=1 Tax=Camellia sinensis var. sinensis TaxID=542762 RepID=A0A4S4D090_CAMSN|nr:hypothetical protein TEA_003720 [Camellia sinensis var. sinensis]
MVLRRVKPWSSAVKAGRDRRWCNVSRIASAIAMPPNQTSTGSSKTPGGKLVYQSTKKRASGPKCPVTGKRIQGIPHLRPAEYKRSRLSRNRRTVNRAYGGVLSGGAVRERIIRAFLVEEQKIVKAAFERFNVVSRCNRSELT